MSENYLKVGSYTPGTDDTETVVDRGYYRQGFVFKNEAAFLHDPDKVCYVPELSDGAYTRQDFLDMCNGQEEFARECFYAVDWQSPETWIDEQYRNNEWQYCPYCRKIYDMAGEEKPCPVCAWNPEEVEDANTESECRPAEPGSL